MKEKYFSFNFSNHQPPASCRNCNERKQLNHNRLSEQVEKYIDHSVTALTRNMTVTYNHEVATGSKGFGNFLKLLVRWKGSIYKLVYKDMLLYCILYVGINLMYRLWMADLPDTSPHKKRFHLMVDYCENIIAIIPLQFLLAFYVSQIVTRWWAQYMCTPWPDTTACILAMYLSGQDDRGRLMRRTIIRYVNLCILIVFITVSPQARKRFPTMDHIVDAGFLLPHEKELIEKLDTRMDGPKYFAPIVWACGICGTARKEDRIANDITLYHLITTLNGVRGCAGEVLSYDWICIPIVYTQVVTLATYIYFFALLIAKQQFTDDPDKLDLYVPVFDFLNFFFMMGWFKVAETLINPFGEDEDDFEVNWLVDRNIQVSYLIVDEMNSNVPELKKDLHWDTVIPEEFYYTQRSLKFKTDGYDGSAQVKAAATEAKKNTGGSAVMIFHGDHHPHNIDKEKEDPESTKWYEEKGNVQKYDSLNDMFKKV